MGNTRVSFDEYEGVARVIQKDDYYPFGLQMSISWGSPNNKRLYQGKELQTDFELGVYDFEARFLDNAIPRTWQQDPLAEKYYSVSPYSWVNNNPMRFIDPTGMAVEGAAELLAWANSRAMMAATQERMEEMFSGGWDKDKKPKEERRTWRTPNYGRVANGKYFDERGREILGRWLNGKETVFKTYNGMWGQYMKANKILNAQITEALKQDALSREKSGIVYFQFHAEIENGYNTGYQMLHGTDSSVGDFEIGGKATVNETNVEYDLTLTWNDKINPNYTYDGDIISEWVLNIFYSPKNYSIEISWDANFIVKKPNHKK